MSLHLVRDEAGCQESGSAPAQVAPITLTVLELALSEFDAEDFEGTESQLWANRLSGLSAAQRQILLRSRRYWRVFWLEWTTTTNQAENRWPIYTTLKDDTESLVVSQVDTHRYTAMIGNDLYHFDGGVFLYHPKHNCTYTAGLHLLPTKSLDSGVITQRRALIYVRAPRLGTYLQDLADHLLGKALLFLVGNFM